ncbi:hypothetical protein FJY69_08645, partial [candidate division WOR-3 bacterium]|nr:hypothetical protein [candidate division WOR-3 bacterium]
MPLSIGQILQGRYRILRPLGQGGMGAVYLAEHTALAGRRFAIKENVPDPNASAAALAQRRQQFYMEAQVLAALDHPHLPKVSDYFSDAGNEYLVMDYVEGQNLQEALEQHLRQQGKPLPEKPALIWADQVLDALEYLHGQRPNPIVHRDIKPANIVLTPQGKAKLVDFGLVKLYDPGKPGTATVIQGMGTPEYTPLEQYPGGSFHTDPRSDIYALGATLYHLLTGQAPPAVRDRLLDPTKLAPPRRLNPTLSSTTEAALLKGLEIHPDQRFQTTKEMRQTLAGGRALPAQPAGPTRPASGPPVAGRRPGWRLWVGLAGLLLLLAFLAFRPGGFLAPAPTATLTPTTIARGGPTATPSLTPPRPTATPRAIAATNTPVPTQTRGAVAATNTPVPTQTREVTVPTSTLLPGPASAADLTATAIFGTIEALTRMPSRTPTPTPTVTRTPDATRTAAAAYVQAFATATAAGVAVPDDVYFNPAELAVYVRVPAGEFRMGSSDGDADADSGEKPQHTVSLDEFWIMQTEVTNAMFGRFVAATGYKTDAEKAGSSYAYDGSSWKDTAGADWRHPRGPGSDVSAKAQHPVVHVSWNDAVAYCKWAGGRLPTEAEWEKTARGPSTSSGGSRKYPWGDDAPTDRRLNYNMNVKDTTPVGSYPAGASPYGALD